MKGPDYSSPLFALLEWTFRIVLGGIFLIDGSSALRGGGEFTGLLKTAGISGENAMTLLVFIGMIDVLVGILLISYPVKPVFLWAVLWPFVPGVGHVLAGDSFTHAAGEYGPVIGIAAALLVIRMYRKGEFETVAEQQKEGVQ